MKLFKAPGPLPEILEQPSIFLAGTMGVWRDGFIKQFTGVDCTIMDPTNSVAAVWAKMDSSNEAFVQQVKWERGAMERVNIVVFHFDKWTTAPISLLELGGVEHCGLTDHVIVYCETGYKFRGHVELLCKERGYGIIATSLQNLIDRTTGIVTEWHGDRYESEREHILDNMR